MISETDPCTILTFATLRMKTFHWINAYIWVKISEPFHKSNLEYFLLSVSLYVFLVRVHTRQGNVREI